MTAQATLHGLRPEDGTLWNLADSTFHGGQAMKAEFQVIRDGAVIFRCEMNPKDKADFANESRIALNNFFRKHPAASLTNEDIIMRWGEPETAISH